MSVRNIYSMVNMSRFLMIAAALAILMPRANAQASCTLNTASPSVTICTPSDGATGLTSPVHVNAGTTDNSATVNLVQIYVDGVKKAETSGNFIDANVSMATGTRRLTVQAKDSAGTVFKKTIYVTVGG